MELWQFNACVDGYTDRQTDDSVQNVHTGYWSAYYTNAKHAKKPSKIAEKIYTEHERARKQKRGRPDVDVEAFLKTEANFKKRLKELQKER